MRAMVDWQICGIVKRHKGIASWKPASTRRFSMGAI